MYYLIDSFDPKAIAQIAEYYPVEGVTTNPTIVAREKVNYPETLKAIRKVIGEEKMLHVETMQTIAEEMVREAVALREYLGGSFYVKLPVCAESLKALRMLKKIGIGVTMTAIFSAQQALVSARAGADFVAPYVNKMDDVSNGCETVGRIMRLMNQYELPTKVLSASFRNVEQVTKVADYGSHYITLPPAFFEKLIWHPMTDLAVAGFERDWESVYGDKKPIDLI